MREPRELRDAEARPGESRRVCGSGGGSPTPITPQSEPPCPSSIKEQVQPCTAPLLGTHEPHLHPHLLLSTRGSSGREGHQASHSPTLCPMPLTRCGRHHGPSDGIKDATWFIYFIFFS